MAKEIVVIGCGHWGKNLIRNFFELDSLLGICDTDRIKLDSFKAKYHGILTFSDYDEVLQEPVAKAVVISTPVSTHYLLAKKALLSGKDVFVEKPIALCYEEAEELVSLARERKRVLMVGHVLLYHPAIRKLKSLIDEGELGEINYIYSNRLNLGKFRTEENILWSFAPHDISVILYLLNDEMPLSVSTSGESYLNHDIIDVTLTTMNFPAGVKAHIFVSWLHPFKEQKLVIIGKKKMILFDDVQPKKKLYVYDHEIDWTSRNPVSKSKDAREIPIDLKEPLRLECEQFIDCIRARKTPLTDGEEGLRVLKILEASQRSLEEKGKLKNMASNKQQNYFVHETSRVDLPCDIGEGTKIWHFSHILKNCKIGKNCVLGQNVSIGPNVRIGNNVKIQNNVAVYEGVTLEDDVFCGPSMVFTNVSTPRSNWPRKDEYQKTLVKQGATLGANSTVMCGITIGRYAFVGAGALANKNVPEYALVYGIPARIKGWMCYCGVKLSLPASAKSNKTAVCSNCGRKYRKKGLSVSEVSTK